jgi:cellulose synthase operon protein C
MILEFHSLEVLRLALTADLVPQKTLSAAVNYQLTEEQNLLVECSANLSRTSLADLKTLGVTKRRMSAKNLTQTASCWLCLLPVQPVSNREIGDKAAVLFDLPAEGGFDDVVSEVLRLGNDRQSFRTVEFDGAQRVFLRVIGPPYYSLLRALDRNGSDDAPTAYIEHASRVWIELGYQHPMSQQVVPPVGQLLMIDRTNEWRYVPEAPFRDAYQAIEFQLPNQPNAVTNSELERRLSIPLKLVRGGSADHSELWVLTASAFEQFDQFVSNSDERLLQRLSFAVAESDGNTTILLRVRPSKNLPPVLVLDALPCAPYLKLSNLFLPAGHRLHPPLRRDVVKQILADDASLLTWLEPVEDGSFVPQTISDSAFRPLTDWVEYVLDRNHEALDHWMQSTQFDFESFVCPNEQPIRDKPKKEERPKTKRPELEETDDQPDDETAAEPVAKKVVKKKAAKAKATTKTTKKKNPSELEKQLRELEQQYLAMDAPLDDETRRHVWIELAQANAELQLSSESGICWGHAFWETTETDDLPNLGKEWFTSESRLWEDSSSFASGSVSSAKLKSVLQSKNATPIVVNSFASWLIWHAQQEQPSSTLVDQLGKVQEFLERSESQLSIRSTWLTWCAFSKVSGGDVLALARARDRILERLFQNGMTPDRDVPSFLRASGMRSGDRFRAVREEILNMRGQAQEWAKKNRGTTAETTREYIDMTFAYAMARLGEARLARELFDEAKTSLEKTQDKIHLWFIKAYEYRIEQAIDGRPSSDSLPDELLATLEEMRKSKESTERFGSFKVDRLRQRSQMLEPSEVLDPYQRYHQRFSSDFTRMLSQVADIQDRSKLADRISELLSSTTDVDERVEVVIKALEVGPRLGEAMAQEVLAAAAPMIDESGDVVQQARLLERAIFLAANFDQTEYVTALVEQLHDLLESQAGAEADTIQALESLLAESFKGMRKLGMRDNIARLLEQMAKLAQSLNSQAPKRRANSKVVKNDAATESHKMMLQVAAGWFFFGQNENAWPMIDNSYQMLINPELIPVQQTQVACAYAYALGQAPVSDAMSRFQVLFKKLKGISDSFTTNSHFSLSQVVVVESVLLSMVSDDFTMTESGRRWLDDDEFLIRRRIHQDVRAAMDHE